MNKINLISENQIFAEDLVAQIEKYIENSSVELSAPNEKTDLVLIDEDKSKLKETALNYPNLPRIFLSSAVEASEYADVVIKKPLKLFDLLTGLKHKTLLPKVRQKECLNFKEYSLYPTKKEIVSSLSQKVFKLTEKEVAILKYLYQNAEKISEKEELLENVWGYKPDITTHTVETHIYRLRQKVEEEGASQLIITENNGYRLNI